MSKRIPLHIFLLFALMLGIMYVSGAKIRTEKIHDPRPRILSLVTSVPDGYVKVLDITDGDTISVVVDGEVENVRMLGVDTPETKDPRRGVQCFGKEASEFTKSLLMGQAVMLVADPKEQNRDDFGRLLRYVSTTEGEVVGDLLVSQGFAFASEKYPTTRTPRLLLLEEIAKRNKLGLWAECSVTIKDNGKQKSTNKIVE